MPLANEFSERIYGVLDHIADVQTPGGVPANAERLAFTSAAFDHYVARHGVPTTANQARHMFESAASLDRVSSEVLKRLGLDDPRLL